MGHGEDSSCGRELASRNWIPSNSRTPVVQRMSRVELAEPDIPAGPELPNSHCFFSQPPTAGRGAPA